MKKIQALSTLILLACATNMPQPTLADETLGDAAQMRGGLNHSAEVFSDGTGHVVFLGGSITRQGDSKHGWAKKTQENLQADFPDCEFTFENVGIPSIGSVGHAHRFVRDVLSTGTPDLLFVEAAVNDRKYPKQALRGMEGVVRTARKMGIDVVMIHMATKPFAEGYGEGKVPETIASHEQVAEAYGVPSLNIAQLIGQEMAAGNIDWRNDIRNLHPSPNGHRIYAEYLDTFLDDLYASTDDTDGQGDVPRKLIDAASYINGKLVHPHEFKEADGADAVVNWTAYNDQPTREGFVNVPTLVLSDVGDTVTYEFEGTGFGLFLVAGNETALTRFRIDNGEWQEFETFSGWCDSLHLPDERILADGLRQGKHTCEIEVIERAQGQSGGNHLVIAHVLTHGAEDES